MVDFLRLKNEAPDGGILISYKTFAQIKDEIHCEERVAFSYAALIIRVASYRVIGLYVDLAERAERIRSDLPNLKLDAEPTPRRPSSCRNRARAIPDPANQHYDGVRRRAIGMVG